MTKTLNDTHDAHAVRYFVGWSNHVTRERVQMKSDSGQSVFASNEPQRPWLDMLGFFGGGVALLLTIVTLSMFGVSFLSAFLNAGGLQKNLSTFVILLSAAAGFCAMSWTDTFISRPRHVDVHGPHASYRFNSVGRRLFLSFRYQVLDQDKRVVAYVTQKVFSSLFSRTWTISDENGSRLAQAVETTSSLRKLRNFVGVKNPISFEFTSVSGEIMASLHQAADVQNVLELRMAAQAHPIVPLSAFFIFLIES